MNVNVSCPVGDKISLFINTVFVILIQKNPKYCGSRGHLLAPAHVCLSYIFTTRVSVKAQ